MYNIIGLLLLILDIYVIFMIVTSAGEIGMKIVWIVVVLLLPLVGPILYFALGRGGGNRIA